MENREGKNIIERKEVQEQADGTKAEVVVATMTLVTLTPIVDSVATALREASEKQGGTFDAFVNSVLRAGLAAQAKAQGRLVISKLGEKLVKWGHAGLTADQIQLRIEQEKKKAQAFHALALELED